MHASSAAPHARAHASSTSVVVITDVDGILRHDDIPTLAEARPLLDALPGSRVVLCSSRSAAELRALQAEIGSRQPFISDGGAALHIPSGYFCGADDAQIEDGYETIDFGARRLGHAVRLLIALFRTCPDPPLVVGIGFEWRDRVLLRAVDVPVVLRTRGVDQTGLLRNIPDAHVTDALDAAGLADMVFGHGSVGRTPITAVRSAGGSAH